VMRIVAWVSLIVSCVVALGFLATFVDLLVVHFFSPNASMYGSWALLLGLFAASAYVALRSFRTIRRPSLS
jgi:hypothetical protein